MGHHDHSICIGDALARAEKLCEERGSRFTTLRRTILEMVWEEHKAVKAYDLLAKLSEKGVGSAKPPTVYRTLEFLMEHGLVHKVESLNAYVGCPHPGEKHISQFLICDACEEVSEITVEDASMALLSAAEQQGFDVRTQTVELHGKCNNCD